MELRLRGENPFDQMPLQSAFWPLVMDWRKENGENSYCKPILKIVYTRLFFSGYITKAFFLPNWRTSKGTRWERWVLRHIGVEIHEFPLDRFNEIVGELGFLKAAA